MVNFPIPIRPRYALLALLFFVIYLCNRDYYQLNLLTINCIFVLFMYVIQALVYGIYVLLVFLEFFFSSLPFLVWQDCFHFLPNYGPNVNVWVLKRMRREFELAAQRMKKIIFTTTSTYKDPL